MKVGGPSIGAASVQRIRGFSLFELIVAVTILSLAMLPLFLSVATSSRSVRGSRDYSGAVFVAQMTLEELRSVSFKALKTESERINTTSARIVLMRFQEYERQIEVKTCKVPAAAAVRIRVTWEPKKGGERCYELNTLITSAFQP